jgi:hypothetical protein
MVYKVVSEHPMWTYIEKHPVIMKYAMSVVIAHKKSNILVLCECETWSLTKCKMNVLN